MRLKFIIIFFLWGIVFYPVFPDLVSAWLVEPENSHGMLVPIISLYFVWQKKIELKKINYSTCNLGAVVLIISLICYLLTLAGGIVVAQRLMIITSLAGLVLFTMGPAVFNLLAFPFFFLLFMIPVPFALLKLVSFPLQLIVTKIATILISLISIPVYREGNILFLSQTSLEVVDACSGIRSIVALTKLSVLLAFFEKKSWVERVILILSALPIAFVANVFRVTITGILAHFFGDVVARGFMHDLSGYLVFIIGFILLGLECFMLNRLLKRIKLVKS